MGSQLIHEWGFDLQTGVNDKLQRNNSSYQPNDLTPINTDPAKDLELLTGIWDALEPGRYSLESHLLRKMLELQASNFEGAILTERATSFSQLDVRVQSTISQEFLERCETPNDHILLTIAKDRESPAPAPAMIARALLLLRLSASIAEVNLRTAGLTPLNDLGFWWTKFGEHRGLWSPTSVPNHPADLWLDVQDALSEIIDWAPKTRHDWLSNAKLELSRLFETERAGLWTSIR